MREILFRAKRIDNGEWIEGYYATQSNHACFANQLKHQHFIFKDVCLDFNLGGLQEFRIIPETVGQFTGLTDKNGKKIFEGDILDCCDRVVFTKWHSYCGTWDSMFIKYSGDLCSNGITPAEWKYRAVVIGNIHDNPELLKGGEE